MKGNPVVVSASHEAIQDYDWPTAWRAGESRYSRDAYEQIGDTRLIRVTTDDCASEDA